MAETDVAIVGGGPAGAALAIQLARRGIATTLLERREDATWRACGVFSSPLTRTYLGRLGLADAEIGALQRPISGLDLETTRGVRCGIEYRDGHACGFDRIALERRLLERAREAGATVEMASVVRSVRIGPEQGRAGAGVDVSMTVRASGGDRSADRRRLDARVVVGADGSSSLVARAASVHSAHRWFTRAGITFHRADPGAAPEGKPMRGRFVFGRGWYMGIAPVPYARVNVGIVTPRVDRAGATHTAERLINSVPGERDAWMDSPTTDWTATAGRLEHHARRVAGRGWLLVGDAIGFVDPLSGEGLLRAFVSAELAAEAVRASLSGDRNAFADYDRRVRRRFAGKNVVSWMLQLFVAQPLVFDYVLRRLGAREHVRDALTLVLSDQHRPSRVVDPRFVAALLRP